MSVHPEEQAIKNRLTLYYKKVVGASDEKALQEAEKDVKFLKCLKSDK